MYTNTNTIKLFDSNNNLLPDFDARVEEVLKSVHGENYYDTDEELVNTNIINTVNTNDVYEDEELEKTIEFVDGLVPTEESYNINIVEKKKKKVSFKDFIPVIFFILMFAVIVVAGYYFLNHFDLTSLLKK